MPELRRVILLAEASDKTFLTGGAFAAAMAEKTTVATSYAKVREQKIYVPGTYRIRYTYRMAVQNSGSAATQTRLYKNGVAIGPVVAQTAANSTPTNFGTYITDFPGWTYGDLCQVYAQAASGDGVDAVGISIFLLQAEFAPRMSTFPLNGSVNA